MKIDFTGRRILVTGSTSGIGFAAAKALLESGATVVINGRSASTVDAALKRLPEGAPVTGFAGDLGDEADFQRLRAEHPEFDVVINNIGIFGPSDFFDIADEEWERFFQTNVMSGVRTARAYAPGMVERGWGRVIFVSSESAINIPVDMIHYGFTKTAQLAISRGLAKRLAGTGVTVNVVMPGPTLTEGSAAMFAGGDATLTAAEVERRAREFVLAERSSSIIQRQATVEEVANMIVYVASEQASATTGSALRVDGGVVESIV